MQTEATTTMLLFRVWDAIEQSLLCAPDIVSALAFHRDVMQRPPVEQVQPADPNRSHWVVPTKGEPAVRVKEVAGDLSQIRPAFYVGRYAGPTDEERQADVDRLAGLAHRYFDDDFGLHHDYGDTFELVLVADRDEQPQVRREDIDAFCREADVRWSRIVAELYVPDDEGSQIVVRLNVSLHI